MNSQVERFDDDLATRIFPMRFRRIGNPYAFLNEVGLTPMLEYIYKGNLLLNVAEALNVSLTILRKWVEEEGHAKAVEEAERISAEGYLAEGMRLLRTAQTQMELGRAREMIRNAQFMASKKDKTTYGTADQAKTTGGISYTFNINGTSATPAKIHDVVATVINAPQEHLPERPLVTVNLLKHLLTPDADDGPVYDADTPIGALFPAGGNKDSPRIASKATADEPELGPFYDA